MISVLRLTSGAEIVGTITKMDSKTVTVNNPLQIMYLQRTLGAPSVTLQRYIPFISQEDLEFKSAHIETIGDPIKGLPEYYDSTLKIIKSHIDPSLVADLTEATESKTEKTSHDSYLAMLEKFMSKKPLN